MFLGFIITVIIILLVIILLSTGALDEVIGAEHTKSSKILTEITSLSQGVKLYKSVSLDRTYKDLSLQKLVELGIIKHEDLSNSKSSMFYLDEKDFKTNNLSKMELGEKNIIASKAIPGIFYNIKENKNNSNEFLFEVILDKSINGIGFKEKDYLLEKALEKNYKKLENEARIETGLKISEKDGIATIIFK